MNDHLVFLDLGSFEIYWFSFIIGCAILISSLAYCKLRQMQDESFSDALTTTLWAVPVAFLLSRISYCWFRQASFSGISEYLDLANGGFSIFGVMLGIIAVLFLRSKCTGKKFSVMCDAASPALAFAIALGRFAGGTSNEETGFEIHTDISLPFLLYSEAEKANLLWVGFFEGLFALLVAFFTIVLFKRTYVRKLQGYQTGCVTLCFMVTYGLSQALLESMKNDSLFMVTLGFVRIDQIFGILLAITAIVVICVRCFKTCGPSPLRILLCMVCAAALAAAVICEFSLNATYLFLIYLGMAASLAVMWAVSAFLFFDAVGTNSSEVGTDSVLMNKDSIDTLIDDLDKIGNN